MLKWFQRGVVMGVAGLLSNGSAQGQALGIDTTRARLSTDRLLAYTFANDAFFRTDYYFTQGMSLTAVFPALSRLPTRHVLLRNRDPGATSHFGVRLLYDGFTPLRIQDPEIRVGDRPYASYIYATFFHAQTRAGRERFSSGLQLGFIGPAAGAKGFQTGVHRWLNAPTPRGWDYQVRNDVVVGYEIAAERQLAAVGPFAELIGTAGASLSTLRTNAAMGAVLRLGRFNPYFSTFSGVASRPQRAGLHAAQLYTEGRLEARAVGFDATMQGGIFNRTSPYTLAAGAIRRGVLSGSGAVVLAYQGFSVRTVAGWISPEFSGARSHAWGQLDVRVAF